MARSYTITQNGESRSYTIEDGVGPAGSDAEVTTANVRAAGALMDDEVDADIKTLSLPANTTISTFGASLIDDAAASNARTTLGLGTAATQDSTAFAPIANYALLDSAGTFEELMDFQSGVTDGAGGGVNFIPSAAGTLINSADSRLTDERVPTSAGLASKITSATAKATPADADELGFADSAASFILKKLTFLQAWTNYFKGKADALYVALTGNQTIDGNKTFTGTTSAADLSLTGYIESDSGIDFYIGVDPVTPTFSGIWLGNKRATATDTNFRMFADSSFTYLNAPTGLLLRAANSNMAYLSGSTIQVSTGKSISFADNSGTWNGSTFTGAQAFSSTTRPTSSGTGTPASNSLITYLDGQLHLANLPDIVLDGQQKQTDGATNVFVGTVTGSGYTDQAANYLRVNTGATTGSTAHFCGSPAVSLFFGKDGTGGLGWVFDSKWIVTFRADIISAAANTDGYFVLGQATGSTSTTQPTTKSCGFRFHDQGVYGFVHDGSTYTESASSLLTLSGTNVTYRYAIHNDDTNINFYINGVLADSITAPTGSTGNGFQAVTFWANNETTTNDMYIRVYGGIRFSNIP